jgi:hypothetical protein
VGFWLWALVGGGVVFGFISFLGPLVLLPAVVFAFLLMRRSEWKTGPVLFGLIAGAGLPLLVVAGLQWTAWHQRTLGDNTPNPYDWGGVGLCLLVAGAAAFALRSRRRS